MIITNIKGRRLAIYSRLPVAVLQCWREFVARLNLLSDANPLRDGIML